MLIIWAVYPQHVYFCQESPELPGVSCPPAPTDGRVWKHAVQRLDKYSVLYQRTEHVPINDRKLCV